MRTILTRLTIGLAFTMVTALGADNTIGTWKLNIKQSKFNPGALPVKSLTVLGEASDNRDIERRQNDEVDDQRDRRGRQAVHGHVGVQEAVTDAWVRL
jgi:hypothetical protein